MKLPRHEVALSIHHNEHKTYYSTVAEELSLLDSEPCWLSSEDRQKAIDNDDMWEIMWYPKTPVGFHRVAASSLEGVLQLACAIDDEEEK